MLWWLFSSHHGAQALLEISQARWCHWALRKVENVSHFLYAKSLMAFHTKFSFLLRAVASHTVSGRISGNFFLTAQPDLPAPCDYNIARLSYMCLRSSLFRDVIGQRCPQNLAQHFWFHVFIQIFEPFTQFSKTRRVFFVLWSEDCERERKHWSDGRYTRRNFAHILVVCSTSSDTVRIPGWRHWSKRPQPLTSRKCLLVACVSGVYT